MSFCRITGKARGLPKPNYFPLLPPISPADAKRCCRITTKSQGLPGHHFIPALLGVRPPKAHCRVTAKSEGQAPHHFPDIEGALKPHDLIQGYKYVFPSFDEGKKQQKLLMNLLSSKVPPGEAKARYVYSVEEKSTGLVIPAELEAAVRDGDVRDVMLDKEGDTMLVKMLKGPNVTIDVVPLVLEEGDVLWDGWGPSEKVLKQRRKEEREAELRKKKRQEGLMSTKKIFEECEEKAEMEQIEQMKRAEMRKAKLLKVKLRGSNEQSEEVEMNAALTPEVIAPQEPEGTMFGNIVQTATGVEFFPKSSPAELPKGKIVPGRLIKSEEGVRFVPGIMVEGRFVPGQVVVTNTGEQFVPGQVVETTEGPKFVPGQVVETLTGPKFVPGQTIETEDGPQFVPGQIIETKAGPTFIPGQVIFTEDTPRFVPGRVVETSEGPRFVPGRVIESGNQVSFVSGQVVETPEGLKFVAPDLVDDSEGGHEFSVQGFDITPEELKLLRPTLISNPSNFGGDMAIDSRMLRQLSEAGMTIGRQVPAQLPAVDVRSLPQVLERMKLTGVTAVKMGHVLSCLSQVARKINDESDVCVTHIDVNEDMGSGLIHAAEKRKDVAKYLKSIVASAVATLAQEDEINEEFAMAAIASAIDRALGEWAENLPMDGVVEYLHGYLTKPQNISNVAVETVEHLQHNETVLDRLQFAVGASANPAKAADKIAAILKDSMGDAFKKLSSGNPELVQEVLKRLQERDLANNDQQATEMVQHAIVEAVRAKSGQFLHQLMLSSDSSEGKEFKDLLLQSIGLARALGMAGVASVLLDVVNDVKSHEVLANDPTTMDILERLMVMRQFAEMKPELHSALRQLVSDPELARSDPGVRELVRHSAALMIVPEECVQTSADIPASLLMGDNTLAMEEFLVRNRRPRTLLIIKPGMQAVVPRDMARAVITGQVPYAVLDEKGIKYFEPKHLFSTMKLPQYAAHCFSMYVCPEVEDDSGLASPTYSTPRGSVSSCEDLPYRRRYDWNRRSSYYNPAFDRHSSRRGTMQSGHVNTKHILDRRLSDWANGTLFIEKAALSHFEYDSLGCDNNGSLSFSNSDEDSSYGQTSDCLSYKLHQVLIQSLKKYSAQNWVGYFN